MKKILIAIITIVSLLSGCSNTTADISDISTVAITAETSSKEISIKETTNYEKNKSVSVKESETVSVSETGSFVIPEYTGSAYTVINNNVPFFTGTEDTSKSFETYSNLDVLGRCGVAFANIGWDLMPTKERGQIGQIKPSGWHSVKYDIVDGKYLYNRCHLIGFQLTSENANKKNLITGTRYMNTDGMLPFENMVADYIKETNNHVLYRVTPMFEGNDLVSKGVLMEAKSVEDNGKSILFNVFVHNIQPGIFIDYATGNSKLGDDSVVATETKTVNSAATEAAALSGYILNTNSKKIHKPTCHSAEKTAEKNKEYTTKTKEELLKEGYTPCKNCNP